MGINVDKLKEGLTDYNSSLERHLLLLKVDFDNLNEFYSQLAAEYEGTAAEQFKTMWEQTEAWFESYMELSGQLSATLDDRIENLKNV